jgi:hypothetical protein
LLLLVVPLVPLVVLVEVEGVDHVVALLGQAFEQQVGVAVALLEEALKSVRSFLFVTALIADIILYETQPLCSLLWLPTSYHLMVWVVVFVKLFGVLRAQIIGFRASFVLAQLILSVSR